MRRSRWLTDDARKTFAATVAAIEARTSAEVVVTVSDRSARYRHVDYAVGLIFALAMLLIYVYFPVTFHDDLAAPSVLIAFVAGVVLASAFDAPKRLFVSRRERHELVQQAARAAFVEQRISVTRARSGVLVYVSLLENDVVVVTDVGVDLAKMGEAWSNAVLGLETCARRGAGPHELATALLAVGVPLAASLPVGDDDVNELPDAVVT